MISITKYLPIIFDNLLTKFFNVFLFLVISFIGFVNSVHGESSISTDHNYFGLVFQSCSDYKVSARRFGFAWDTHDRIEKLSKENRKGDYFRYYNLVMLSPSLSNKYTADYNYIVNKHPEWLIKNKEGKSAAWYHDKSFLFADIGNSEYAAYVIKWLENNAFNADFKGHLGLDYGIFFIGSDWASYETHAAYQNAWETFLQKLSEAFRPRYKILINIGSCDLATLTRMLRWVDGVLQEDLCSPPHRPGFEPEKARRTIQDRWDKGQWCSEHGKIWAVRYNTTVQALKIMPAAAPENLFISVGDKEIILSKEKGEVITNIDLTSPEADSLFKLAKTLERYNLRTEILNPYSETTTPGKLAPIKYQKLSPEVILKFKQPPQEAFLFGFAAVLMAAGPRSYFILNDERHQEYYYPEMEQSLGNPLTPKTEVAPQVFKREFKYYTVFLNLSSEPYPITPDRLLLPWRGALIKKQL